jgi:hypothetical protein
MTQTHISKDEFIKQTTALTVDLFSGMSREEQERRMKAAEDMLTRIENSKTVPCTADTSPSRDLSPGSR